MAVEIQPYGIMQTVQANASGSAATPRCPFGFRVYTAGAAIGAGGVHTLTMRPAWE
jgi:hypothetical protein